MDTPICQQVEMLSKYLQAYFHTHWLTNKFKFLKRKTCRSPIKTFQVVMRLWNLETSRQPKRFAFSFLLFSFSFDRIQLLHSLWKTQNSPPGSHYPVLRQCRKLSRDRDGTSLPRQSPGITDSDGHGHERRSQVHLAPRSTWCRV